MSWPLNEEAEHTLQDQRPHCCLVMDGVKPKFSTGKTWPQVFTVTLMFSTMCSEDVLAGGNINTLHVYIIFLATQKAFAFDS